MSRIGLLQIVLAVHFEPAVTKIPAAPTTFVWDFLFLGATLVFEVGPTSKSAEPTFSAVCGTWALSITNENCLLTARIREPLRPCDSPCDLDSYGIADRCGVHPILSSRRPYASSSQLAAAVSRMRAPASASATNSR